MQWLIIVAVLGLAGCSGVQEAVGLSGPQVGADVTVVDQHGVVKSCAWSSKRPGVYCPVSFEADKGSGTVVPAASDVDPLPLGNVR